MATQLPQSAFGMANFRPSPPLPNPFRTLPGHFKREDFICLRFLFRLINSLAFCSGIPSIRMLLLFFLSFFKQLNGFDQKIFFVSLS
jgi:hypothetical protein